MFESRLVPNPNATSNVEHCSNFRQDRHTTGWPAGGGVAETRSRAEAGAKGRRRKRWQGRQLWRGLSGAQWSAVAGELIRKPREGRLVENVGANSPLSAGEGWVVYETARGRVRRASGGSVPSAQVSPQDDETGIVSVATSAGRSGARSERSSRRAWLVPRSRYPPTTHGRPPRGTRTSCPSHGAPGRTPGHFGCRSSDRALGFRQARDRLESWWSSSPTRRPNCSR